jgi:putative addiction module CopG family antidote
MNVTLTQSQTQFVAERVKSGRYIDSSDVVRQAIRLLQAREAVSDARYLVLGSIAGGDITALAFIVMMESAKSAQDDLKAVMDHVKSINRAKEMMRELIVKVQRDCAANAGRQDDEALDLSRGLGSERAYHKAPVPHLDPDAPGGVRLIPVDLCPGRILRKSDLCVISEDLKGQLDSLSEMGEMQSLRMQMAMERYSKAISTLSNALKSANDTADQITQNIK